MLKNPKWAEKELKKYLRLVEKVPSGDLTPAGNPRLKVRGTPQQITQQRYVADRIYRELFVETPRHFTTEHAHHALVEIQRAEELAANLGDESPSISADSLHPWVWSAASSHWASDAHRAAVWAAGVNVNSRLQKKLKRADIGESKLIQQAFSLDSPRPGSPRLRLCDETTPDLFKDLHTGAMQLGTGLYAAVRNPVSHITPEEHDLGEQEALECLAALSLFARWVQRAVVERHDDL